MLEMEKCRSLNIGINKNVSIDDGFGVFRLCVVNNVSLRLVSM